MDNAIGRGDSPALTKLATGARASQRQLIVSADDFGMSPAVNAGIVAAHLRGVLTNASLMVNGQAFDQAVQLARAHPTLAVGLHLVLLQGYATLPRSAIPGLVDESGQFARTPVATGLRYFFVHSLEAQLEREIRAQLEKFLATGLRLSHVDGHLNIHMHPRVLNILVRVARDYGLRAMRLPREPLSITLRASRWQWWRKVLEALTFRGLVRYARPRLDAAAIRYPDRMFGLHQSGHMTLAYLEAVLRRLPPGVTEVYTHASHIDDEARRWRPANYESEAELRALTSPQLRELLAAEGIVLVNYHHLAA